MVNKSESIIADRKTEHQTSKAIFFENALDTMLDFMDNSEPDDGGVGVVRVEDEVVEEILDLVALLGLESSWRPEWYKSCRDWRQDSIGSS